MIGVRGTIQRAALQALLGIAQRVLVSDLGQTYGLDTDGEPCAVHQQEHAGKATVQFADAVAPGILECQGACGVGTNAMLVLKRDDRHPVG
ncbi:hypothetical protein D3C80_1755270 [compost metagenome]